MLANLGRPCANVAAPTRVHVKPAPEMVSVCPPADGPSEDPNAEQDITGRRRVESAVVRVPAPSENTEASTIGPAGAGPDDTTRLTALPPDAWLFAAGL